MPIAHIAVKNARGRKGFGRYVTEKKSTVKKICRQKVVIQFFRLLFVITADVDFTMFFRYNVIIE